MSHIVYVTNGMSSTLNSSLELSRRLVDAGHRVTYVSPADVEETVRAHGHAFHRFCQDRAFVQSAEEDPPPRAISPSTPAALVRWILRRRRLRREASRMQAFEALVRSLDPDLLVLDYELHLPIITASTMDVPIVLAIVWFTIFRHPDLPPLEFREPPASGAVGRARVRLLWLRSFAGGVTREWRRLLSIEGIRIRLSPPAVDTLFIEDIRAVARARGFDLRRAERTNWLRPLTYPEIPTLCFNLREMEFAHEPHPSLRYVGPMIARERTEVRGKGASATAWSRFLDDRESLESPRPLVYCSLGTHWSADQAFLGRVMEVFRRRPDWDLVLGLGSKLDPRALHPVPENALVLAWAPQLEVLRIADVAITHGGITTINECVAYAVPMLVYSTGKVDQDGCAARVEHHGLGLVGDRERDGADEIERRLEAMLGGTEVRANVEAMRARLLEVERTGSAVATIEGLIRSE